ncbi:Unknown protein, partial [Striga hermonthica]
HEDEETSKEDEVRQTEKEKSSSEIHVSASGLIPTDQLKEFIMGTIKDKFDGVSKSSLTYSKPYTQRIDSLKMSIGYQPPKFQPFDGKGSPKQHVAHFIETCNDAGTYGDRLVKQFVRSLKGNAFEWYTNLEANSIDSWEQLEQEFLNRFYSARRTMKRPEEAGQVDNPKYCRYHCLVSHSIEDCFVFKDRVMQLAQQGKISLEEDKGTANFASIVTCEEGYESFACNVTSEQDDVPNDEESTDDKERCDPEDNNASVTFTDEDLMLGSKPHNRPLFVTGYTREKKVNRILIDGGSAMNIFSLRTLKELEVPTDELSNSRLMIQGFNQGGQRALGIIRLKLVIREMTSNALFHVIDAKTSYNMLLGRPWLHEYGVVPSTWHQ